MIMDVLYQISKCAVKKTTSKMNRDGKYISSAEVRFIIKYLLLCSYRPGRIKKYGIEKV